MKATNYIKTAATSAVIYSALTFGAVCTLAGNAYAASPDNHTVTQVMADKTVKGDFVRKNKTLKGSYDVFERDGQTIIRFADNFKASNGPDLKVFLSPTSIDNASGRNATQGSVLLGFVKSNKGAQEYVVPADVNIANFNSVLIHCEKFSVLWGGGNI